MDIIKEKLYERGTCNDTYLKLYQKQGIAREYRRKDSPTFDSYSAKGRSDGKASRGVNEDNRQSGKYGSGYSLSVGENGEITESFARRYSIDDSYLSAVERGDMETAQRGVDEAAKNPNIRYSVNEEAFTSPTIGNVAKSRFDEPKPKMKEKIKASFISAKDKLYIEGVDELCGVEKYLKKFGGRKDAQVFVR